MDEPAWASAAETAKAVAAGHITAAETIEAAIARIAAIDPALNAFTAVTAARARATASRVDAQIRDGVAPGHLAGVPFTVKALLDVAGSPTLAGSHINRDHPPARKDALLIDRLEAAGAILVGSVGMGEYAYDYTGENAHTGPCRNPHDTARIAGGSSSGSAAAVAAGLGALSLGSDTNGSLRVPASLCGIFSLKPTYGRLPRSGTFPFVDSLDHLGPLARSSADLAIAYDALQGHDPADHACADRGKEPVVPVLGQTPSAIRFGIVTGWLRRHAGPQAIEATDRLADALTALGFQGDRVALDEAEAGRAAAFLITSAEGAAFHIERLRNRARDLDPYTRDRLMAGAMLPASWLVRAQRVRRWWLDKALRALNTCDALIVPATPVPAPMIGADRIELGGADLPLRPNLGLLAQPFSCIGLPVVTVPVFALGTLPIGVQIITRPWQEALALQIAHALEDEGIAIAHRPPAMSAGSLRRTG